MERDWRHSNAPQWAKDAAQSEIDAYRLTAALSWPTEARPLPVPFRWGEYDRLIGDPIPGVYWTRHGERVEIAEPNNESAGHWGKWRFRTDRDWTTIKPRGPLFDNERDAFLWQLWDECEAAARKLMILKSKIT